MDIDQQQHEPQDPQPQASEIMTNIPIESENADNGISVGTVQVPAPVPVSVPMEHIPEQHHQQHHYEQQVPIQHLQEQHYDHEQMQTQEAEVQGLEHVNVQHHVQEQQELHHHVQQHQHPHHEQQQMQMHEHLQTDAQVQEQFQEQVDAQAQAQEQFQEQVGEQVHLQVGEHVQEQQQVQEQVEMQVQVQEQIPEQQQVQVHSVEVPEPTSTDANVTMNAAVAATDVPITDNTEELSLKESNASLVNQVNALLAENSLLKHNMNVSANANGVIAGANVHPAAQPSQDSATATAAAAAQLTTYQNALALSESQKQELMNENQLLRQRLIQAGIQVNDIGNPVGVGVSMPVERKIDGDTVIDITEAEALAAIDPQHHHVQHGHGTHPAAHAHAHAHDVHNVPPVSVPVPVPMTPNTAGLSSRSEEKWEMHFARLTQYKNEHGNCLVPTSTELGRWLCRQRHNYRYKNLKEERKQRLMDLDKTCLGERIADLGGVSGYVIAKTEGDINSTMPPITTTEGGIETANAQAQAHPTHLLNTKTKYNQAYESKLHAKWDKFYQQLLSYKEEHGHCNFPTMNGSLGRWISRQRTLYRSQKLKADRYQKLLSIGFAFEDATALEFKGKLDQQWEAMFQNLMEHKEQKGHCFDVPETLPLGKWLYRQRWLYRHGNLRTDRADKLLSVGFEDKKVLKKNGSGVGSARKKRKRDDEQDESADSHDQNDAGGVEEVVGDDVVAAAIAASAEVSTILAVDGMEGEQPMDQHTVPALEGDKVDSGVVEETQVEDVNMVEGDLQAQTEAQTTEVQVDAQEQAEAQAQAEVQQIAIEEVMDETIGAAVAGSEKVEEMEDMVGQEASV